MTKHTAKTNQAKSRRRKTGLDLQPRGDSPFHWPGWHAPPERLAAQTPHDRLKVHRGFRSRILPDRRDLIVYLPPGYESEPERRYPVLYLNDGQNLFDPATSFIKGQTWRVRETADEAIEAGEVEPLIIVGIYNTGDRRLAEYTHERDWQMGGGEADSYGALLTRELMPWIAEHYRVRPEREHTGLGGSSLGGLVSLYLGLKNPEIFGRLAVLSPSVWWNHRSILRVLNEVGPHIEHHPRIWLDAGDHEGRMTLKDTELLAKQLRNNGWRADETLHFEKIRGGKHNELSWAERVGPMLRFLFPA
jgi:predicted alpha/beta superfamily hydrolase